ncbi:hypothetical protein BGZ83_007686 [Gryganskiella cystojenkinii]|nr:hypothetical protein BGZ83_007686 [Gryganskiella cystojenkinii]
MVLSPIQLVALSNLKLNNDMFSNRSLSIHKRILVKNLLTLLYQLNPPMDWTLLQLQMQEQQQQQQQHQQQQPELLGDNSQGQFELEQKGQQEEQFNDNNNDKKGYEDEKKKVLDAVIPARTSSSTESSKKEQIIDGTSTVSSSSPDIAPANAIPLPRPKSTELPQSLHTYLSTVFDVDWSVGLPNTEDSLFTHATAAAAPVGSYLTVGSSATSTTSLANKRKSLTSGLSSVTSAFSDFTTISATTTAMEPPRTSVSSTISSYSSLSTTSTVSSVSSVGSMNSVTSSPQSNGITGLANGLAAGLGFRKQQQPSIQEETDTGPSPPPLPPKDTKPSPTLTLVRKSSLSSNYANNKDRNGTTHVQNNGSGTTTALSGYSNGSSGVQPNVNGTIAGNSGTATNISSDGRIVPTRKASISSSSRPMLVPGRRSSLLPPGQIPLPLSPPASAVNTSSSNNNNAHDGYFNKPDSSSSLLAPPGSFGPSYSPATSPTKATFGKRTSSLAAERPKPIQRTPSSENTMANGSYFPPMSPPSPRSNGVNLNLGSNSSSSGAVTTSVAIESIIGLPRPLLGASSLSGSSSSLLSSSPPPSPPGLSPSGTSGYYSPPPTYARATSDDPNLGWRSSPSSSATLAPPLSASSALPTPPSSPGYSSTLPRPQPTYMLKASKSSPCLVSGGLEEELEETVPAVPFNHKIVYTPSTRYVPQPKPQSSPRQPQRQIQPSSQYQGYPYGDSSSTNQQQDQYLELSHLQQQHNQQLDAASSQQSSSGFKLLARTSSRRGASGGSSSPALLSTASTHSSGMNISAPLPLIPNTQSYSQYDYHAANTNNRSPYGQHGLDSHNHGGYGMHGHSQSMTNLSLSTSSPSSSSHYQPPLAAKPISTASAALGRWNSMKTMFGLRVGQGGSSTASPSSLSSSR